MERAILVCGLGFGDEGKGQAVDFLTRKYNSTLTVRYNGGHNAAHRVVTPEGKQHVFSQFGSGTFVPGVRTHLSRYMMVNPIAMMNEEIALQKVGITDAYQRLTIDGSALVVTPFDKELNILKEKINNHGSCGVGIGETRLYNITYGEDSLFANDLLHHGTCKVKLRMRQHRAYDEAKKLGLQSDLFDNDGIINWIMDEYSKWNAFVVDAISIHDHDVVVFEGAQGVLLDQRDEFLPHNTWSDCTFANADKILAGYHYEDEVIRVGCIRSYMTRHGNGPFNEDKRLAEILPEAMNLDECFQGRFKRSHFDKGLVNKALDVCGGVDEIHMSHLDYLPLIYPGMTDADIEVYLRNIERFTETPITVTGYGPTCLDRREREKAFIARRRSTEVCNGVS